MTLHDLAGLDLIETLNSEFANETITGAYTSDLLSDVMANAQDGCILITIQAHNNTIAVASLAGVIGILVCNNRPIPDDMIEAALKERIAIFRTKQNQFQASCLLGKHLGS